MQSEYFTCNGRDRFQTQFYTNIFVKILPGKTFKYSLHNTVHGPLFVITQSLYIISELLDVLQVKTFSKRIYHKYPSQ